MVDLKVHSQKPKKDRLENDRMRRFQVEEGP